MHQRTISVSSYLLLNNVRAVSNPYQRCYSSVRPHPTFQFHRKFTISSLGMTLPKSSASASLNLKERLVTNINESQTKTLAQEVIATDATLLTTPSANFGNEKADEAKVQQREDTILPAVLEYKIQNSNSTSELLNLATSSSAILKHACLAILRLSQLAAKDKLITLDALMKDMRFVKVSNLVERGDYSQNPNLLFLAIHGLRKLGALETSETYQTLNIELKWAMRRCPVKYLGRAIALFSPNNTLGKEAKNVKADGTNVYDSAVQTLQRRWVEVTTGTDFISVFKILNSLDHETQGKLEDRAVEMVQSFSPSEIRQIFIALATQRRRPTPLLRALSFHFSKLEEVTSAKDLIDLIYALNELTFADPILMEKISSSLCPLILEIRNSALISSLVTSLGQMRYKHKGLMQILDEWTLGNLNILRPFDYAAWILTCAVLNHQSENTKEIYKRARSVLRPSNSSPIEWINIVHALLVLNEHTDQLLTTTLSPEFIESIDKLGRKNSKSKIKLLNINAAAKHQLKKGYTGPLLSQTLESEWTAVDLTPSDPKMSSTVLETLSSFLPPDKYLKLHQKLSSGVFVDAVCLVDSAMKPIPVTSETTKANCKSVALVVEGYASMCLGWKEPTGQTMFNRNLLEADGYQILSIPYTEFSSTEKLVRRVKYLENKMKSIGKSVEEVKSC